MENEKKNKRREMDCRLRVCVKMLCKICYKWPIRELFILRLQHWCFYIKFYWWNCSSGAWRNCQVEQNYGIVLAECIHMQVSSAGVRTEHVNYSRESARTDHCQTFHRGRRMLVSLPSRNPTECFSSRLPQVVHGRRHSWSPTKQEMRIITGRGS